jgi:hypothetical protein
MRRRSMPMRFSKVFISAGFQKDPGSTGDPLALASLLFKFNTAHGPARTRVRACWVDQQQAAKLTPSK